VETASRLKAEEPMSHQDNLARVIPMGERTSYVEIPRELRPGAVPTPLIPPPAMPQPAAPAPPVSQSCLPNAAANNAAAADAALLPQVLEQLHDGVCLLDLKDRIRFWNSGAERITGYKKEEVVGRNCHDRVFVHASQEGDCACGENCPNKNAIATGARQDAEYFLHHKNGYRLPISLRVAPLRGQSGAIIGTIHIFAERQQGLAALQHALDYERFTFLDPLTEAGNRKYTEVALHQAIEAFVRYGRRPGVAIIDVDRLTHVNRAFGLAVGDQVLKAITKTLISCLRPYDFLGRWADDQFYAILADTHAEHLASMANKCRAQVAGSSLDMGSHCVQVSISVGTSLLVPNDTLTTWLGRAERNLHEAKSEGGNRVITDPMHTLFNWFQPEPNVGTLP
jgi:diguanylate cyclase (GGDEF)-like protein/PAS domain S-box-containing protein